MQRKFPGWLGLQRKTITQKTVGGGLGGKPFGHKKSIAIPWLLAFYVSHKARFV